MLAGGLLLGAAALAALVFLASQAIHAQRPRPSASVKHDFLTGTALACGLIGYQSLIALLFPSAEPRLALLADYATQFPAVALILAGLQSVGSMLLLLVVALGLARFTTQPWRVVLIGVLAAGWWLSGAFASRELLPVLARTTSMLITLTLVYLLIRLFLWQC